MIDVPTPGNLIKTISELVIAANAGGGFAPGKLDAEANPSPSLVIAPGGFIDLSSWTQDAVAGTGMSVNGDGIHFDLTKGDYLVNLYVILSGVSDQNFGVAGAHGFDVNYSDAGPTTGAIFRKPGSWWVNGSFWGSMSADGQIFIRFASVGGGTTNDAITYAGIDIIRIG